MDSDTQRDQGEADAYWRRRVYALAGGLTVVGLLAWACSGSDHKRSTAQARNAVPAATPVTGPAAAPVTPAPAAAVATGTAGATPAATVTVTATPSVPPPAARRSGDVCDERDVVVGLTPTKDVYPNGERPRFRMSVVNTGRRACAFDVGAKALRLRITSGADPVWSSDRCSAGPDSSLQLLRRGVPYIVDLTWDRRRCDGASHAAPGTYVISARQRGLRAARQVFRLR